MAAQEVTKNFSRQRCGNLPERLQKTNFVNDGLPVGCSRRKLESCGGQILLSERPSFNFQQLITRFHLQPRSTKIDDRRAVEILYHLQKNSLVTGTADH
jgi:hypothetical protein